MNMTENSSAERLELLLKAYDLLSDITPKKYDCGILCSSVCCKNNGSHGNDKECGMLLLPGEKELLSGAPDYTFLNSANETLLVCDGKCIRELRPFACRIFPFYPKIVDCSGKYSVRILPDPRSFNICPITNDFRKRKARIVFIRNAKKAVRILMRDKMILEELIKQSDMISDIEDLRKKLLSADIKK